jgi:enediyne biosynthesis protein E4
VAKGNVEAQPGYAVKDPSNLLLQGPDGTFTEAAEAAGLLTFDRGRGAAVVDLNLDGLLDVVEVMRVKPTRVWRNLGSGTAKEPAPMGHWVGVRPVQDGPNRDAIGAWVEVRVGDVVQTRELTVGGGHVSGDLGFLHLGLGDAEAAEVRVTWPDGEVGPWQPVAADGRYLVRRGADAPTLVDPAGSSDGPPTAGTGGRAWPGSPCPTSASRTRSRSCLRRCTGSETGGSGHGRRSAATTA